MAYSIGKAKRDHIPKDPANVGPGSYNPKIIGKKKEPKWGFGTGSRGLGNSESQPTLKTNTDLSSSNKENSATRIWIDKMASPGPGQYEAGPVNHFFGTPSTKFGQDNRFSGGSKEKLPGPGAYTFENLDAVRENAPKFVFGSSQRGDSRDKERKMTPGPGAQDF